MTNSWIDKLPALWNIHFGSGKHRGPLVTVRAPGRVNLIGEHTDYNDGYVFPMAIDRYVAMCGRVRDDQRVRIYSRDFNQMSTFSVDDVYSVSDAPWSNYIRGVIDTIQRDGFKIRGFDAVVGGDIPPGAGLSSPAALEVATAAFIDQLFECGIDGKQIAQIAQRAENDFVGVACGIMDQLASSVGKEGHGLLLDCRSLDITYAPLNIDGARFVVVNTNKRRGLVDSEYNARRQQCERGGYEGIDIHNFIHTTATAG